MSIIRSSFVLASLTAFASFAIACSSKDPGPKVTVDSGSDPGDTGSVTDTGSTPDVALDYPPGPYGLKRGEVFPRLTFKGYKNSAGEWVDIDMADYYDPDGSRGVHGILLVASALWCGPCKAEADQLAKFWPDQYKDHGGRFLTSMIEGGSRGSMPTQNTVKTWIRDHHIGFDIGIDPDQNSVPPKWSIPYSYVINPRDMTVFRINTGYDSSATTIPSLNAVMKKNGATLAVVDAGQDDTGDPGADDTGVTPDDSATDDGSIVDADAGATDAGPSPDAFIYE